MARPYSPETVGYLAEAFSKANVLRPRRIERYEPGAELQYDLNLVAPAGLATCRFTVVRCVGGGFAGQVYQVRCSGVEGSTTAGGLRPGGLYALKILIPPGRFAKLFREIIYFLGFQGPFSLQVNPSALRAGALWQKLIRRAGRVRFGREDAVADVLATLVDENMGSCAEIGEWVDGRTWRLEADDRLDLLRLWRRGMSVDPESLGSDEYRAKKQFMADFVRMLHELGAVELARQYEWMTCKSQPNVLKRLSAEGHPAAGLTAVDFRAGLALLPVLPMSPADFRLIAAGLARGRLVQFDRGDLEKLEAFVDSHKEAFADLGGVLDELKTTEREYRSSLPDVTHHHVRLLYSPGLWRGILDAAVRSWEVRNLADADAINRLRRSRLRQAIFAIVGLIPFLGRGLQRILGRADYRRHYSRLLSSADYFGCAFRAHVAETLIRWHRGGRVGDARARRLLVSPGRFLAHLPFAILPARLHRFLTDGRFAAEGFRYIFVRPVRLYFDAEAREQWLRDMLVEGRRNHILTDDDAATIESRIKEPFIQKYLKSLAVHVCTLPVTQIVSVLVALLYVLAHPELTAAEQAVRALGILGFFQVIPISPGSLVRGVYVLYLVIRERNFKDYNIAVFLGFFKYVGYLAFPIQMAYHYPALARFMAGHWATGAVHVVPVFGERGALLERGVFNLFYNWPLTIRRKLRLRSQRRSHLADRWWPGLPCVLVGLGLWALIDAIHLQVVGHLPALADVWYLVAAPAMLVGAGIAAWAGGAKTIRRIKASALGGTAVAALYAAIHTASMYALTSRAGGSIEPAAFLWGGVSLLIWSVFLFGLSAAVGGVLAEVVPPVPEQG